MGISIQNLRHLRITRVGEVEEASTGRKYFPCYFKQGLSKPIRRAFWSVSEDLEDGWERLSPEDAKALMKQGVDLSEFAQITASRIEPEEWVDEETGELRVTRSRTVVQFQDETLERALAAYGSKPFKGREEKTGEEDAAGSGPVQKEKASAFNLNGLEASSV